MSFRVCVRARASVRVCACGCVCVYYICIYTHSFVHTYIHGHPTFFVVAWGRLRADGRMCVKRVGAYGLTGETKTKKKSEDKRRIRRYESRRGPPLGTPLHRAARAFMQISSRLILLISYGRGYHTAEDISHVGATPHKKIPRPTHFVWQCCVVCLKLESLGWQKKRELMTLRGVEDIEPGE